VLRRHGAVHRKARAGHLSPSRVIGTIQICRLATLGGRTEQRLLPAASLQFLNHRHCSECQGSARAEWLTKGVVYSIRFTAAAETLRIIVADPKHLGAEIGLAAHLATEPGSPRMSCRLAGHLPAGPAGSGAVSDSLCR